MKLLIISNMAHYIRDDQVVGWGPAVEEINYLSRLFSEIRHVGCLQKTTAPVTALPYLLDNIKLIPVPPAGGEYFAAKVGILRLIPLYLDTILKELKWADVVHVRCPANIGIVAIVLLALKIKPQLRWVKYAGAWKPDEPESWSFRFQRWWLNRGFHRGVVTVNGRWADQPDHVYSFLNPCLSNTELTLATSLALEKKWEPPYRLLYVGQLNPSKGVDRVLKIFYNLRLQGIDVFLDLIGDGPNRREYEKLSEETGIADRVTFHGWVSHPSLGPYYEKAHFMIFPSDHEGWPKVLSEAMARGTIPIASAVGSVAQVLSELKCGIALPPKNIDAFVNATLSYIQDFERCQVESRFGVVVARHFTYESYLESVKGMFLRAWSIKLVDSHE